MRIFLAASWLLLATSVRADINDAGNLNINDNSVLGALSMSGSSSTITTQSSFTASAFFGDGSHLGGWSVALQVAYSSVTLSATPSSTTNTSYEGLPGSTVTITTSGSSHLYVRYTAGMCEYSGAGDSLVLAFIDETGALKEDGAGNGIMELGGQGFQSLIWQYDSPTLSAGTYSVSMMWKNGTGGIISCYGGRTMRVQEVRP